MILKKTRTICSCCYYVASLLSIMPDTGNFIWWINRWDGLQMSGISIRATTSVNRCCHSIHGGTELSCSWSFGRKSSQLWGWRKLDINPRQCENWIFLWGISVLSAQRCIRSLEGTMRVVGLYFLRISIYSSKMFN